MLNEMALYKHVKVTLTLYKQEGSHSTTVHPPLHFHKSGISNDRISK